MRRAGRSAGQGGGGEERRSDGRARGEDEEMVPNMKTGEGRKFYGCRTGINFNGSIRINVDEHNYIVLCT